MCFTANGRNCTSKPTAMHMCTIKPMPVNTQSMDALYIFRCLMRRHESVENFFFCLVCLIIGFISCVALLPGWITKIKLKISSSVLASSYQLLSFPFFSLVESLSQLFNSFNVSALHMNWTLRVHRTSCLCQGMCLDIYILYEMWATF